MTRRERRQRRSSEYKAGKEYDRLYSKGIGVRYDSWNGEYVARGTMVVPPPKCKLIDKGSKRRNRRVRATTVATPTVKATNVYVVGKMTAQSRTWV